VAERFFDSGLDIYENFRRSATSTSVSVPPAWKTAGRGFCCTVWPRNGIPTRERADLGRRHDLVTTFPELSKLAPTLRHSMMEDITIKPGDLGAMRKQEVCGSNNIVEHDVISSSLTSYCEVNNKFIGLGGWQFEAVWNGVSIWNIFS